MPSTGAGTLASPCSGGGSRRSAAPEDVRLAGEVRELAAREDIPFPNVDLALAALAWATGMASDAGQVIFMVARFVGWVAHYLEELDERPLRYRARAVYATPRPAADSQPS